MTDNDTLPTGLGGATSPGTSDVAVEIVEANFGPMGAMSVVGEQSPGAFQMTFQESYCPSPGVGASISLDDDGTRAATLGGFVRVHSKHGSTEALGLTCQHGLTCMSQFLFAPLFTLSSSSPTCQVLEGKG